MQTHFLAPHMAEPCLSGATLLSAVGTSNSATAGGHGWATPPALRVQDAGMPRMAPKLSSALMPTWGRRCRCQRCPVPHVQQLAGWTAVPRAHVGATGSEPGPIGIWSGLVTCAERAPMQLRSPTGLGPARYAICVLLTFYHESYFERY